MKFSAGWALRRHFLCGLFLSAVAGLASGAAEAKNLSGRLGLGASNISPGQSLPSLSVDWQISQANAFEFDLGLDTQASSNSFLLGLRYARNLYIEDSQFYYLYLGGGLASASTSVAGSNASGFRLESGVAAKFFLSNLPNLGLSLGAGFQLDTPGSVRLRTVAFGGFHYYF